MIETLRTLAPSVTNQAKNNQGKEIHPSLAPLSSSNPSPRVFSEKEELCMC
jgi:hypothetical protein